MSVNLADVRAELRAAMIVLPSPLRR